MGILVESTVNLMQKNNNKARILITEISTKGTNKYCDRVEFIVTKKGNLAGLTIADGFFSNYTDRCVLPNLEVTQGDIFVVAFQKNNTSNFF